MGLRCRLLGRRPSRVIGCVLAIGMLTLGVSDLLASNFLGGPDSENLVGDHDIRLNNAAGGGVEPALTSAGTAVSDPGARQDYPIQHSESAGDGVVEPALTSAGTAVSGPGSRQDDSDSDSSRSDRGGQSLAPLDSATSVPQVPDSTSDAGRYIDSAISESHGIPSVDRDLSDERQRDIDSDTGESDYEAYNPAADGEYGGAAPHGDLEAPFKDLAAFCNRCFNATYTYEIDVNFDLTRFVKLLTDCLSVIPQPKINVNGKELSIVEAMSMDSTHAMRKLSISMQRALGRTLGEPDLEELVTYLTVMNNFLASLSSTSYDLKNRIQPEYKNLNLIINYLVYGGYLSKLCGDWAGAWCGYWTLMDISDAMWRIRGWVIGPKGLAINLSRWIVRTVSRFNPHDAYALKEDVKRCLYNCRRYFVMNRSSDIESWIEELQHKDGIVFIKDWWNVSREDLEKARKFLLKVLNNLLPYDRLVDVRPTIRDYIRPYLLLLVEGGCPFEAYFKDILTKRVYEIKEILNSADLDRILQNQEAHRINSERMFLNYGHASSSVDVLKESIADFIAREQRERFWPLPEGRMCIGQLVRLKDAILEELPPEMLDKKVEELLSNNGFLIPYISALLHASTAQVMNDDDFHKTVRDVLRPFGVG